MPDTDLINAALVLLGQEPMADPAHPRGRTETAAVLHCDEVRDEILESQHWTSCDRTARIVAEADVVTPPGFGHVGLLPADYLGLWRTNLPHYAVMTIGEGDAARRRIAWSGADSIVVRYSGAIPYRLMSPLLRHAAATRLAARCAFAATDDLAARKAHADLAVAAEMKGAARDALNRREEPLLAQSNWDPSANGDFYSGRGGSW